MFFGMFKGRNEYGLSFIVFSFSSFFMVSGLSPSAYFKNDQENVVMKYTFCWPCCKKQENEYEPIVGSTAEERVDGYGSQSITDGGLLNNDRRYESPVGSPENSFGSFQSGERDKSRDGFPGNNENGSQSGERDKARDGSPGNNENGSQSSGILWFGIRPEGSL